MLDDLADYMIHVVKGIKYWDMCASDALIRARYGVTSNKFGLPLVYEQTYNDDYTIINGVIMARSKGIYELCNERIADYLHKIDIEEGIL